MTNWLASKFTPLTRGPGRALFDAPAPTTLAEGLDRGAVIVLVLPVGPRGQATTALTARMFLSRLTAAVAHQADRPEQERPPVSVFIDEAHLRSAIPSPACSRRPASSTAASQWRARAPRSWSRTWSRC